MHDRNAAGRVRDSEEADAGGIIVEVRLSDEALERRISEWIDGSPVFVAGAARGERSVLIADHLPDDVDAPVILLAEDDSAGWTRNARVAARLTPPVDFVRLRIAAEAAAHGLSVSEPARKPDLEAPEAASLTQREIEVLHLLGEGASNKVIARALGISAHTVKFHVAAILVKLGAASRTEAVTSAIRLGLLMV